MKYRRFEEIPVWNAAVDLAVRAYDWSDDGAFRGHPGLRDQFERAVQSISNNIAEGFERGTREEFITFLYYAKGSAGEVCSMLAVLARAQAWADRRSEVAEFASIARSVLSQLGGWLRSIQNASNPSPRHENDSSRHAKQMADRQSAFLAKLKRYQDGHRDEDFPPVDDDTTSGSLL